MARCVVRSIFVAQSARDLLVALLPIRSQVKPDQANETALVVQALGAQAMIAAVERTVPELGGLAIKWRWRGAGRPESAHVWTETWSARIDQRFLNVNGKKCRDKSTL
jgi:hypothetical protein